MAVNIKSPRVDALIAQLRDLTGRGATEIVREALAVELQRQRRLRRRGSEGRARFMVVYSLYPGC
jgi:hypothetical protein